MLGKMKSLQSLPMVFLPIPDIFEVDELEAVEERGDAVQALQHLHASAPWRGR